jgi:putative Mg2+ transporter-C (MgtC) family protein
MFLRCPSAGRENVPTGVQAYGRFPWWPSLAVPSCSGAKASSKGIRKDERIIEGVITGMGFIGGGAILKTGETVRGTATAASLWATGAIGVASAVGSYDVAVNLSAITLVTLRVLAPFKAGDPER